MKGQRQCKCSRLLNGKPPEATGGAGVKCRSDSSLCALNIAHLSSNYKGGKHDR